MSDAYAKATSDHLRAVHDDNRVIRQLASPQIFEGSMKELMDPRDQKIVVLVGVLGTLLGFLQAKGDMSKSEIENLFQVVDQVVPDSAEPIGLEVLISLRNIVKIVANSAVEE